MTKTAPDKPAKKAPLARVMQPINYVVERWIPSSLVFAIVLTVIVALLALIVTPTSPVDLIVGWGDGLAGLLAFMTQMALILLLGHMLANTKPVRRLLDWVADKPNTPMQAYLLVFVTAAVASLITWGLGLVVGGLLAKEVARSGRDRGLKLHFPMLVAAGFSGFVVWHMGYSGSGPLTAATPDSFIAAAARVHDSDHRDHILVVEHLGRNRHDHARVGGAVGDRAAGCREDRADAVVSEEGGRSPSSTMSRPPPTALTRRASPPSSSG